MCDRVSRPESTLPRHRHVGPVAIPSSPTGDPPHARSDFTESTLDEPAILLLEDGRTFDGIRLGASGPALGEVVFNTSMSGYQEVLTDPSYAGQLVTMTYPLIGNYGTNAEDEEADGPQVSGFIVREAARRPSSWRSEEGLSSYLERSGVVGIAELDTRALTRHIRERGAMRGAIAPSGTDREALLDSVLAHPKMEGLDLVDTVTTAEPYQVPPIGPERFHVLAYDLGVKAHSPGLLARRGCRVTVVPSTTSTDDAERARPDGLFVSNGPGDPATVEHVLATIRTFADAGVPVFGICLGHQLVARAFGGSTFKLPFGHHGGNHPVKRLSDATVEITSQNHGFAVEGDERGVAGVADLTVTHVNLYDHTIEGIEHRSRPVFAVQYHPEAAPGPHDSRYLFDRFIELMEGRGT